MANKDKINAIAREALKAVTQDATAERKTRETYGYKDIERIEKAEAKRKVKELFDAYSNASNEYDLALAKRVAAKKNLQNILDRPFLLEGRIDQSRHWIITGFDEAKRNIFYSKYDRDYEERYERQKNRRSKKGNPAVEINQDAWDFVDKEAPDLVSADDFLKPKLLSEEIKKHVAEIMKRRNATTRLQYINSEVDPEIAYAVWAALNRNIQKELFVQLPDDQRQILWNLATDDERKNVEDIMKPAE